MLCVADGCAEQPGEDFARVSHLSQLEETGAGAWDCSVTFLASCCSQLSHALCLPQGQLVPVGALRAQCALAAGTGAALTWLPAGEQQPLQAWLCPPLLSTRLVAIAVVPEVAIWGGGSMVLLADILSLMDLKQI